VKQNPTASALSQKLDHPNYPKREDGYAYDYDYEARFGNG